MKKTSRTFKRFAAITSASLLAACMVAPMVGSATVTETEIKQANITIENTVPGHTYEAYQIFKGTLLKSVDDNNTVEDNTDDKTKVTFTDVKWGENVNESADLYDALAEIKDGGNAVFVGDEGAALDSAAKVAEKLQGASADVTKAFAATINKYLNATGVQTLTEKTTGEGENITTTGYSLSSTKPGYYLIKDQENSLNGEHDAYTSFIVQVLGDVSIAPKSEFPTVDKQVYDNADGTDAAGWGETADWTINNNNNGTTQFKLIATITKDDNLADYKTYRVKFNDTMSNGVTFDGIASVTVGAKEVKAYDAETNPDGYKLTGIEKNEAGGTFALEIADILKYDSDLTDADTTITVIYNAHLNEKADVSNTGENSITNKNTVDLEYSNNPNWDGQGDENLGKTPKDTVWVATYQVLNYKYDGEDDSALEGVKFKLEDSNGTEIKLEYDDTNKVYYPKSDGTAVLTSDSEGHFNIKGLDAGKYKLVETDPLPGYNTCPDQPIEIVATHEENGAGTAATVTLSTATGTNNRIENNKGSVLPGTGGIGTTVFYLGGGAMVAVAGIYLISKKRMKNTQE